MNRNAKMAFTKIQGSVSSYRAATVEILSNFKKADETARRDSEQYKNEKERYAESHAALVASTMQRLDEARAKLSENIQSEIGTLRGELRDHLIARPNPIFTEMLKSYRNFNLKPTKTELAALLELNSGNALGLRLLNSTLEAVDSQFRIDCATAEGFEKDLDRLAGLAEQATAYSPVELHHEICRVYDGTPRLRNGRNMGETWDSPALSARRVFFESSISGLSDMEKRWSMETVPSVKQIENYKPTKDEDGTEVSAAEQYIADREATADAAAVVKADTSASRGRAIGQQRAQELNKAAETLARYTR